MKITELKIDPKSLGNKLWLVDVAAAYEYGSDGKRLEKISGYKYTVALPEKGLDKIAIRIDGKQQMEKPDGYVAVSFDNLELKIYWARGDYAIAAKATGIHLVNNKA